MNIIRRIARFFRASPKLRNKPGGMAWINSKVDEGCGTQVLVNRIVRTVRVEDGDMWTIDPPQVYRATRYMTCGYNGTHFNPGDSVVSRGIRDDCLTPIPDAGLDKEEVRELYAPSKETQQA